MRVKRTDRLPIRDTRLTEAGNLIVNARPGRTGLQNYLRADGTALIEHRPSEEVFALEALDSLRAATVTRGHTDEPRPKGIGIASDAYPGREMVDTVEFLSTSLVITDQTAIDDILAQPPRLTEISLGYWADLDETPGELPDGRRYDAVQRNIRIHHVALLPPGQARAGRQARIRLDGNEILVDETEETRQPATEHLTPVKREDLEMAQPNTPAAAPETVVKIRLDGTEFVERSAEHVKHLDSKIAKLETDAAAAAKSAGEQTAKIAELEQQLKDAKAVDVDALVSKALAFRTRVQPLLDSNYDFKGKSETDVIRDCLSADDIKVCDGLPKEQQPHFLAARLESALRSAPERSDRADYSAPNPRLDSDPDPQSNDDRAFQKRLDEMWAKSHPAN